MKLYLMMPPVFGSLSLTTFSEVCRFLKQEDARSLAGYLAVERYRLPWMRLPVFQMSPPDPISKPAPSQFLGDQKPYLAG